MFNFIKKIFHKKHKNAILGRNAEKYARKFLNKNTSYKILTTNYKFKNYEADIVCYDKSNNALVIVEVKSRNENALVDGYICAMQKSKIQSVIACKNRYQSSIKHSFDSFRYDVIDIAHDKDGKIVSCRYYENVFPKQK